LLIKIIRKSLKADVSYKDAYRYRKTWDDDKSTIQRFFS